MDAALSAKAVKDGKENLATAVAVLQVLLVLGFSAHLTCRQLL
jgi:hypothetical protein